MAIKSMLPIIIYYAFIILFILPFPVSNCIVLIVNKQNTPCGNDVGRGGKGLQLAIKLPIYFQAACYSKPLSGSLGPRWQDCQCKNYRFFLMMTPSLSISYIPIFEFKSSSMQCAVLQTMSR